MDSPSNDERPFENDDLDDISVTSSQQEENADDLYELERILAQHDEDLDEEQANEYGKTKQTFYLIKWKGYHGWESSWIPESNFEQNKDDVLLKWQDTRMRQIKGHQASFDLGKWEEQVHRHKDPIYIRRTKCREKRRRLGLSLGNDPDEDEYFIGIRPLDNDLTQSSQTEDTSSSDESRPLVSSRHRRRPQKVLAAENQSDPQALRSEPIHIESSGSDAKNDNLPLSSQRRKTDYRNHVDVGGEDRGRKEKKRKRCERNRKIEATQ